MAGEGMPMKKITRTTIALGTGAVLVLASLASFIAFGPRPEKDKADTTATAPTTNESKPDDKTPEDKEEDTADEARDAYIATWAERIDAFNAGYPLEGYGATFAAAAYEYGVDPRYSPAIARVESGSGLNCTYSCNAWGWGSSSWGDWETAIYAHVAGLAQGYGHTVSYEAALSYNELNPDEWYSQVESCMYQIWESE